MHGLTSYSSFKDGYCTINADRVPSNEITEIDMEGTQISNDQLIFIFKKCPNIQSCELAECTQLTEESLKLMPKKVTVLSLRSLPRLQVTIFDLCCQLTHLQTLDLSKTHVDMRGLKKLKDLHHLKQLFLWQCPQLNDEDLEWLKEKFLYKLDVSYCPGLTGACLVFLKKIWDLEIDANHVSGEGLLELATSDYLQKISLTKLKDPPDNLRAFFKGHVEVII